MLVLRMNIEDNDNDDLNVKEAFLSQEVQDFLSTMEFIDE